MMETKLRFAFCALLLITLASAEHDNAGVSPKPSAANTSAATAQGAPSLDSTSQPAPALKGSSTNSSSNGTHATKVGKGAALTPTAAKTDTEANTSLTANKKQPTAPPVKGQATTVLPAPTVGSPPHTADRVPANASTLPTHAPAPISQQPNTNASTNTSQTELPKPETSPSTGSHPGSRTNATTQPPSAETQTHTAPHIAQTPSTFSPPSNSSNLTKVHGNTPSQRNVGGDTTMVHASATVNPLLAGLVSAFIITGVIIFLLLFLKLRRRGSQPEFRRLQDLPMDDMEDAPLSMYTY